MSYTPPISGSTILTLSDAYTAPISGSTIMTLGGTTTSTNDIQATFPAFSMISQGGSYIVGTMPAMTMTAELFGNFMVGQLPTLFLTIQAGYNFSLDTLNMEMPSLQGSLFSGAAIAASFPKMALSGVAFSGHMGNLVGSLPSLSSVLYSGAFQAMTLPSLAVSMFGSSNNLADIAGQLPFFIFTGQINNVGPGSIVATLPMISADIRLLTGEVGNFVGRLPMMNMQISGLPGGISDIEGSFPRFKLRIASIITGDNDMVMVLAPLDLSIESGSIESGVLRYIWERIR